MKIHSPEKTLTMTLNEEEIKFLRDITQNYYGNPQDETPMEKQTRMIFFVSASRALGYDMDDNGNIAKSTLIPR